VTSGLGKEMQSRKKLCSANEDLTSSNLPIENGVATQEEDM